LGVAADVKAAWVYLRCSSSMGEVKAFGRGIYHLYRSVEQSGDFPNGVMVILRSDKPREKYDPAPPGFYGPEDSPEAKKRRAREESDDLNPGIPDEKLPGVEAMVRDLLSPPQRSIFDAARNLVAVSQD
jgi:hypothetical protein